VQSAPESINAREIRAGYLGSDRLPILTHPPSLRAGVNATDRLTIGSGSAGPVQRYRLDVRAYPMVSLSCWRARIRLMRSAPEGDSSLP
jgi:hypothetical protein